MKVIVGSGNPGEEYVNSRHNSGFMVVERLLGKILNQALSHNFQLSSKFKAEVVQVGELMLVKPQTYMNRSGEAAGNILQFYKMEVKDLWVAHDDLDIKLGEYKIQPGKGPKVHNGVNSIEKALGTSEFWRVRLGIDNRFREVPNDKFQISNKFQNPNSNFQTNTSGEAYVLGKFTQEEKEILDNTLRKVTDELVSRYL